MTSFYNLVILLFVRLVIAAEKRISVDTVGSVTATAGYSISDSAHPPIPSALTSEMNFTGHHHSITSKEISNSAEMYTSEGLDHQNQQSLALRSRQARGKHNQRRPHGSGSVEDNSQGESSYPLQDQLYNVKPLTFDVPPTSQSSSIKHISNSEEKNSMPSITYGKKMHKNEDSSERPTYGNGDWSEEVRIKFDGDKSTKSRKKNRYQNDSSQEKRKHIPKKMSNDNDGESSSSSEGTISATADSKDGWQEVSPNLEIATGYSTSVNDHDSSRDSSSSLESHKSQNTPFYHSSESISSIENTAIAEPQNFNHKQVLSKMNHFDFSNAVPQINKASREKRLNYQPSLSAPLPRYPYTGHQSPSPTPLQAISSSSVPPIKSVKVDPPNYHSIVVPIPMTHNIYTSLADALPYSLYHQQLQIATSPNSVHQNMMSLPVVHNVFFKTDENGGGKTMPAIVIPLKPEYLQHLQQQQYSSLETDVQRPLISSKLPFHSPQQLTSGSFGGNHQHQTSSHKPKSSKAKKPVFMKSEDSRIKQPFTLQQHSYYNPYAAAAATAASTSNQYSHQQQQQGPPQYHESLDDNRYAQTVGMPVQSTINPFTNSLASKRPQTYGYVTPGVNKFRGPSAEDTVQLQIQQQQQQLQPQIPFKSSYNGNFAYLTGGAEEDYPYRPIYKETKKRNDIMFV
ncbi:uncharacterized protein LOC126904699 [Daktulosphaira vitifoliae]|uniref:uncharacterized protein LOC126904699 n=1 Tax=Daktulosphaira vitifoliae TaxID=58002 RepID=UPI0021AA0CBE|nr:uncharacterized protein LOC126904699 [Daktulosphaira vitifoliae]